MRYLMAKRLLADVSVLVYQLHPFCAASAAAASPWPAAAAPSTKGAARKRGPNDTGSKKRVSDSSSSPPPPPAPSSSAGAEEPLVDPPGSNDTAVSPRRGPSSNSHTPAAFPSSSPPPPRPPVLVLRRMWTTADSTQSNSNTQSPPLLQQLAGRAVELVEAVASHPHAAPAPASPTATDVGGASPLVEAASAASHNRSPKTFTVEGAPVVCRRVEQLRRGALCSKFGAPSSLLLGEGGTGTAGGSSLGVDRVGRAVGSFVSLLAAMVAAEEHLGEQRQGEQQQQRLSIQRFPCSSPQSEAPGRVDGGKRPRQGGIGANPTATARVPGSLLRLAGVVVRAANRACLLDLSAMQVGGGGVNLREWR